MNVFGAALLLMAAVMVPLEADPKGSQASEGLGKLFISPSVIGPGQGSIMITVIPGTARPTYLGTLALERRTPTGEWASAGTLLLSRRLGAGQPLSGTLNPTRILAIAEIISTSIVFRVRVPLGETGEVLRVRGSRYLTSNAVSRTGSATVTFAKPARFGSECKDAGTLPLASKVEFLNEETGTWKRLKGTAPTECESLAAGLYRVMRSRLRVDRYVTVFRE